VDHGRVVRALGALYTGYAHVFTFLILSPYTKYVCQLAYYTAYMCDSEALPE